MHVHLVLIMPVTCAVECACQVWNKLLCNQPFFFLLLCCKPVLEGTLLVMYKSCLGLSFIQYHCSNAAVGPAAVATMGTVPERCRAVSGQQANFRDLICRTCSVMSRCCLCLKTMTTLFAVVCVWKRWLHYLVLHKSNGCCLFCWCREWISHFRVDHIYRRCICNCSAKFMRLHNTAWQRTCSVA